MPTIASAIDIGWICDQLVDFVPRVLCIGAQRGHHSLDWPVTETIENPLTIPARLHKSCTSQMLKMLRRVGYRQVGECGELLHRAFPLSNMFEKHKTMRMTQRAYNLCKVCISRRMGVDFGH